MLDYWWEALILFSKGDKEALVWLDNNDQLNKLTFTIKENGKTRLRTGIELENDRHLYLSCFPTFNQLKGEKDFINLIFNVLTGRSRSNSFLVNRLSYVIKESILTRFDAKTEIDEIKKSIKINLTTIIWASYHTHYFDEFLYSENDISSSKNIEDVFWSNKSGHFSERI